MATEISTESIQRAIKEHLVDGQLPCASAFLLVEQLHVTPLEIGQQADRLKVKLSRCQLGLFGYGSKAAGTYSIVTPLDTVEPDLSTAIREALGNDGRLECEAAWAIAGDLGVPRQLVANAAEALDVRLAHCQLGAF